MARRASWIEKQFESIFWWNATPSYIGAHQDLTGFRNIVGSQNLTLIMILGFSKMIHIMGLLLIRPKQELRLLLDPGIQPPSCFWDFVKLNHWILPTWTIRLLVKRSPGPRRILLPLLKTFVWSWENGGDHNDPTWIVIGFELDQIRLDLIDLLLVFLKAWTLAEKHLMETALIRPREWQHVSTCWIMSNW